MSISMYNQALASESCTLRSTAEGATRASWCEALKTFDEAATFGTFGVGT